MSDLDDINRLASLKRELKDAVASRVVGQHAAVDAVLTAAIAGGHALLIGAPGLAKTLLVRTVADALGWRFRRIQFTPDLMPSDITGSEILHEDRASGARRLAFQQGPVFGNVVLADEINRAPPKTQAALLEAMQERSVTSGGTTHSLPDPFLVLATQNPVEQEGTYPLPEAQLDRFLLAIRLGYPNDSEELAIALLDSRHPPAIAPVVPLEEWQRLAAVAARVPVPEVVARHAVAIARATRPDNGDPWTKDHVAWGAGPRASQALVSAARARAALRGEPSTGIDDVRDLAEMVLAHRVVPSFAAAGRGIDGLQIVARSLERVRP
jgi:MoxR-like ATPase